MVYDTWWSDLKFSAISMSESERVSIFHDFLFSTWTHFTQIYGKIGEYGYSKLISSQSPQNSRKNEPLLSVVGQKLTKWQSKRFLFEVVFIFAQNRAFFRWFWGIHQLLLSSRLLKMHWRGQKWSQPQTKIFLVAIWSIFDLQCSVRAHFFENFV